MEKFNIRISNQTQQNRLLKIYLLFIAPMLGLVFYQQKSTFFQLEKNTELIIILIFFLIPNLILALKLKHLTSVENVSFTERKILTKLEGAIFLDEISIIKSPKGSVWNKDVLKIVLKNGEKIVFSPIVKQFNNKKNKIHFENFIIKLENTLAQTNESPHSSP